MKRKFTSLVFAAVLFAIFVVSGQYFHAEDAPKRIEITAKRFDFSPSEVTLKKGEPVVIVLTSSDVDHGLKFKELNLTVSGKKGQTNEVKFTPDKAGDFVGQCSVFCGSGHGGMKMTLHVTE